MGHPNKWDCSFVGINRALIHNVARHSAGLENLPRFGAVDLNHPVDVDLGRQHSAEAGERLALGKLARLLRHPVQTSCYFRWHVAVPNKPWIDFTLAYEAAYKLIDVLTVSGSGDLAHSISARYVPVSRHGICVVARKKGTARDLRFYGARETTYLENTNDS